MAGWGDQATKSDLDDGPLREYLRFLQREMVVEFGGGAGTGGAGGVGPMKGQQ